MYYYSFYGAIKVWCSWPSYAILHMVSLTKRPSRLAGATPLLFQAYLMFDTWEDYVKYIQNKRCCLPLQTIPRSIPAQNISVSTSSTSFCLITQMVESSDEPSLLDRIRSFPRKAHASDTSFRADDKRSAIPVGKPSTHPDPDGTPSTAVPSNHRATSAYTASNHVAEKTSSRLPPAAPPPLDAEHGAASSSIESEEKSNILIRFYEACKEILFSSWLNVLLVFVPVGIAIQVAGVNKSIVFAINAIAIIPLAGLLSHATESVASDLGDTIGALMNITFGNAVELIILYVLSLPLGNCYLRFTACMFYLTDSKRKRAMGSPKKHLQLDCVLCYLPLVFLRLVRWYLLQKLTLVISMTTALLLPRLVLSLNSSHVSG